MPKALKQVVVLVVLAGLMGAGLYLFKRYDAHMTEVSAASVEWPSVSGLITHSNLEARTRKTGSRRSTEYDVEVMFEYVVDDQVYRNDVVRFDQANLSHKEKELLVSAHPVGKKVEVYYNPDKPKQSVLIRASYR